MDSDWSPIALDSKREVTVFLHDATPLEVLQESSTGVDITRHVESGRQSAKECSLTLRWHHELTGVDEPTIDQVIEVRLSDQQLWVGVLQTIDDYRTESGERSMRVVARSRDATPLWRNTRRVTPIYPLATSVSYIAEQVALAIGLDAAEISLPDVGIYTVHSNTQLADLTPWQMLTTLLQPAGLEPFVTARGRLGAISRDTQRPADIVIADERRLLRIGGSKGRPTISEVQVKWLDPLLTEVAQQTQILGQATITAGFFQVKQKKKITFSQDERQRARDTYLVVRQSANSGLLRVCKEEYAQTTQQAGEIRLTTHYWVPALATYAMFLKLQAHSTPDGVAGAATIPAGRLMEYAADATLFLTMMSIGTGQYEVWGTPFDYVHARNTTSAYNKATKPWAVNVAEIENDFVTNDAQAKSFAVRELIYEYRAASSWGLTIVDDPRIEPGDIIEMPEGERVYVTDYAREIKNGAPAVLDVQGFRV